MDIPKLSNPPGTNTTFAIIFAFLALSAVVMGILWSDPLFFIRAAIFGAVTYFFVRRDRKSKK